MSLCYSVGRVPSETYDIPIIIVTMIMIILIIARMVIIRTIVMIYRKEMRFSRVRERPQAWRTRADAEISHIIEDQAGLNAFLPASLLLLLLLLL